MAGFNFNEFYGKLSKREKILSMTACGTSILLVMNLLLIAPILSYMSDLDVEIEAKIAALRRSRRVLSFEKAIVKEYAKYVPYFDPADLTQEEIIANLLQKIEDLARKNEVSILSVSPGEIEERKMTQQYTTSLECEGKLPNVLRFVSILEESDYLFQVKQYQFTPKSKSGDVIKVSLVITRMIVAAEDMGNIELPLPPAKTTEGTAAAAGALIGDVEDEQAGAEPSMAVVGMPAADAPPSAQLALDTPAKPGVETQPGVVENNAPAPSAEDV